MNKQCLVTFANRQNNYIRALARMVDSLRYNWDGGFMAFTSEESIGAPSHLENPYAFKIYAIEKALEAGYSQILWLDSSCYAIQPIQPIFDHIDKEGYIMQDAGHFVGVWTNDTVLKYFNLDRDEAMSMRCYGNAGFLGLDFENETAREFFHEWKESMLAGMFKGAWTNDKKTESQDERCRGHRHDLSCGSIIANRMEMVLQSSQEWLQYAGPYDKVLNDKIYLKAEGL